MLSTLHFRAPRNDTLHVEEASLSSASFFPPNNFYSISSSIYAHISIFLSLSPSFLHRLVETVDEENRRGKERRIAGVNGCRDDAVLLSSLLSLRSNPQFPRTELDVRWTPSTTPFVGARERRANSGIEPSNGKRRMKGEKRDEFTFPSLFFFPSSFVSLTRRTIFRTREYVRVTYLDSKEEKRRKSFV